MGELRDANPMDASLYGDGPPHELFERMRSECPVHRGMTAEGQEFWSLTRQADIHEASRDNETFSSYEGGIFLHPDQVVPLGLTRNLLLYKDPPDHTKYRKILQTAFTPRAVSALEPEVRAIVTHTLDDVIEAGSCDFVDDVAVRVPLTVLASMMGLPDEDIPRLYEWTEAIEQAQQSPEPEQATPTFVEMAGYLHEQVQAQIEAGGDTLVTRMRAAEVDGEKLTDDEILVFFGLLVFAGNDTTRNTASSGMLALLEHRDQWRTLCEDPSLIPQAVEEILRYTSVVNYFARTATREVEIEGERIPAGSKVVMWYASSSRDERVTDDPQRFDITRTEPAHDAFGGGGRHFCLGHALARLELRVLFEEVARRMPGLEVAGKVERLGSSWANSLTSLPVAFRPGQRS